MVRNVMLIVMSASMQVTTARSGIGKGYTFGFSHVEGGPTSMRGFMPEFRKSFHRCVWHRDAAVAQPFTVDYTEALERPDVVDDPYSKMMRLGTLDAYQIQLFQRYLGVSHDLRAWASFVLGSLTMFRPAPNEAEEVLTVFSSATERLGGGTLPVIPALEFDRKEGLNDQYIAATRQLITHGKTMQVAPNVMRSAFPMPDGTSFAEVKLFGPQQRTRGHAILEVLGFPADTHICNRLSAQYPVHIPFSMYECSTNAKKTADRLPRARFLQFYVDALFWVAPRTTHAKPKLSTHGSVVLVEYKV